MLKIIGLILAGFFLFGVILTAYAIMGIRYLEEVNQASEEKKNKL